MTTAVATNITAKDAISTSQLVRGDHPGIAGVRPMKSLIINEARVVGATYARGMNHFGRISIG